MRGHMTTLNKDAHAHAQHIHIGFTCNIPHFTFTFTETSLKHPILSHPISSTFPFPFPHIQVALMLRCWHIPSFYLHCYMTIFTWYTCPLTITCNMFPCWCIFTTPITSWAMIFDAMHFDLAYTCTHVMRRSSHCMDMQSYASHLHLHLHRPSSIVHRSSSIHIHIHIPPVSVL